MKRALSVLLCLLLAAALLSGSCLAALLTPPANGYVADLAGVLESDTVERIVTKGEALTQATGAQIVVVTVDFLNGMDINDYALELFNDWGIGDAEKDNGLLILLAIGEDNYAILQGEGIQSALPTSTLGEYADRYLEDDFAAGDYDTGVNRIFDAFYVWFETYYAGQGWQSPAGVGSHTQPQEEDDTPYAVIGFFSVLTAAIIGLIIVIIAIESVRQSVYSRRAFLYPGIVYRPFFIFRPRPPRPYPPRFSRPPSPPPGGFGGGFSGGFGGGHSRGGGVRRSSGTTHRSSGSFHSGGGRSFGGGHSRGGGFSRR